MPGHPVNGSRGLGAEQDGDVRRRETTGKSHLAHNVLAALAREDRL